MDEFENKVMEYLDDLRDSGVTNMFGAWPYIRKRFGVGYVEARRLLALWMQTWSERHPAAEEAAS